MRFVKEIEQLRWKLYLNQIIVYKQKDIAVIDQVRGGPKHKIYT